ncbi:MAG TPA: response regulator transcription factor [Frankiaceae bacterium]|nr:response regulator transcription factor [Frankiaceae bacterium]
MPEHVPAGGVRLMLCARAYLVRAGIRAVVERSPRFRVVAELAGGAGVLRAVGRHDPDVVLVDSEIDDPSSDELTHALLHRAPARPGVVVLTPNGAEHRGFAALQAGARGLVSEMVPGVELVRVVEAVAGGAAAVTPAATATLLQVFVRRSALPVDTTDETLTTLTPREEEVLLHLALGRSTGEIAGRLGISHATVKSHVRHLLPKLGCRDRVQAVVKAHALGLVRSPARPVGGGGHVPCTQPPPDL